MSNREVPDRPMFRMFRRRLRVSLEKVPAYRYPFLLREILGIIKDAAKSDRRETATRSNPVRNGKAFPQNIIGWALSGAMVSKVLAFLWWF